MKYWKKLFPQCIVTILFFFPAVAVSGPEIRYNGHLRDQGSLSSYDENHILTSQNDQTFLDGSLDVRLNTFFNFSDTLQGSFAWEAAATGGETRKAINSLNGVSSEGLFRLSTPSDNTKLFDLTAIVHESDDALIYHRIDRLFFSIDSRLGLIKAGRQPLTWGNGMLFNPMDLVNPFSPSDIIRDYKEGADMLLYQWGGTTISDLQLAVVPGRNQQTDSINMDETTMGSSIKVSFDEKDLDLYLIKNRRDPVLGAGFTSFVGGAAFRSDLSLTFLQDDSQDRTHLSFVANLDYSWVWREHNWYGFVELYYNGLGANSVVEGLQDEVLMDRIGRGELFGVGKWYADGMLQFEAHPLVNLFISGIFNLKDTSFLLQPRLSWDILESLQLLAGMDLPIGSEGDEFGDLVLDDSGNEWGQGQRAYILVTWYFQ